MIALFKGAATAMVLSLTLATRHVADFEPTGVAVLKSLAGLTVEDRGGGR